MIRIASFNVKNLSLATIDKESEKKRDLDRMVDLLRDCDIVVLQEVLNPRVIEGFSSGSDTATLTRRFGSHWKGKWVNLQTSSKYYPYLGDNRNEGYAFLWNTQRIELAKDRDNKDVLPCQYGHYNGRLEQNPKRLMRNPGYGRFKLKTRPVEIRVLTTHIIYSKPKAFNDSMEFDIGAINMRRNEFDIIAGQIYKNVDEYFKMPHMNEVITIIIGDYNLNLEGHGITATIPEIRCFDTLGNVMKTSQTEPTTIKSDCSGYANNYDHCTYKINLELKNIIGSCYRKSAVSETDSVEMIKQYRDTVSDHVPIIVEINC